MILSFRRSFLLRGLIINHGGEIVKKTIGGYDRTNRFFTALA